MYLITHDSGRPLTVRGFHQSPTYASVFEGGPSPSVNALVIEHAVESASRMWGNRPVYVCLPTLDESDPRRPRLPAIACLAWLTSAPLSCDAVESELVALWFVDEPPTDLPTLLTDSLRALPWERVARDCEP